jgi:sugar O-acyltransferase (sialic acid O-acetyltransferase NeuD family)
MKSIAIFGASGFGREVMPIAKSQIRAQSELCKLSFIDDGPTQKVVNGVNVLTYKEWLSEGPNNRFINIAIANSKTRQVLAQQCELDKCNFFEIRAQNVVQLDSVEIGIGAILCPFVTLTSNIYIGRHFHANIYSYVGHDCIIGDYVTFAPGVKCNGNVLIEDHVYVGTGAVIKQGIPSKPLVIGRGAVIGMGAIVTKNVPAGATVIGNPAKPLL